MSKNKPIIASLIRKATRPSVKGRQIAAEAKPNSTAEGRGSAPVVCSGRRKSSVAQVKLIPGLGNITINGKPANDYLQKDALSLHVISEPLKTVYLEDKYDLTILVQGGGLKGQAKAIQLGIAKALSTYQNSLRPPLKEKGFLTRDSRVKERRKYGLKKARKAPQFSKR